jgi:hypothetical protein
VVAVPAVPVVPDPEDDPEDDPLVLEEEEEELVYTY